MRVRLLNNRCAGEVFMSSDGVFLSVNSARYTSDLLSAAFFMRVLACLTAFSAFPLDCAYNGELGLCSKPQVSTNLANSLESN